MCGACMLGTTDGGSVVSQAKSTHCITIQVNMSIQSSDNTHDGRQNNRQDVGLEAGGTKSFEVMVADDGLSTRDQRASLQRRTGGEKMKEGHHHPPDDEGGTSN